SQRATRSYDRAADGPRRAAATLCAGSGEPADQSSPRTSKFGSGSPYPSGRVTGQNCCMVGSTYRWASSRRPSGVPEPWLRLSCTVCIASQSLVPTGNGGRLRYTPALDEEGDVRVPSLRVLDRLEIRGEAADPVHQDLLP